MKENIMNITTDGKVEFDGKTMSMDEFYKDMLNNMISDYKNYHLDYDYVRKNGKYVATYNGKEYIMKQDNQNLEEVRNYTHHPFSLYPYPFPDYDDLDRLMVMSDKQEIIDIRKNQIETREEQSKFFNKKMPLWINDLNLYDEFKTINLNRIAKTDAVLSILLIIGNLFSFFSYPIHDFYTSLGELYWITFIPLFAKLEFDLKRLDSKDGKKTFLYYALYPVLYLVSKKYCKRDIARCKKDIKRLQEETKKFLENDEPERMRRDKAIREGRSIYDEILEKKKEAATEKNEYNSHECVSKAAMAALELLANEKGITEESGHVYKKTLK